MTVYESFKVNIFAIITLIFLFLIAIYIAITAFYFYDLSKTPPTPPTQTESSTMFWASIILGILLLIMAIYTVYVTWFNREKVYINDGNNKTITANQPGELSFIPNVPEQQVNITSNQPGIVTITNS